MEIIIETPIFQSFDLLPEQYHVQKIGNGHIHQSYLLAPLAADQHQTYVLQNINTNIFHQPEQIARNWKKVAAYLQEKHPKYPFLTFVSTSKGEDYAVSIEQAKKQYWRLLPHIQGTVFESATQVDLAYKAAFAFASFGARLRACETANFASVIPSFHDASVRFQQFLTALKNCSDERKKTCDAQIKMILDNDWIVQKAKMLQIKLPVRLQHMDAKIGNVIFTGPHKQHTIILDLDTVMPANILSDAGDMIRSMSCLAAEDEPNGDLIVFEKDHFDAIRTGFFDAYADDLSATEKLQFSFSGQLMLHMQAVRFLTDYLNGNIYYSVDYPLQNLLRAENQLRLLNQLLAIDKSSC